MATLAPILAAVGPYLQQAQTKTQMMIRTMIETTIIITIIII
jgi:hypothetical protein